MRKPLIDEFSMHAKHRVHVNGGKKTAVSYLHGVLELAMNQYFKAPQVIVSGVATQH
jgi:hypothetical protein